MIGSFMTLYYGGSS